MVVFADQQQPSYDGAADPADTDWIPQDLLSPLTDDAHIHSRNYPDDTGSGNQDEFQTFSWHYMI